MNEHREVMVNHRPERRCSLDRQTPEERLARAERLCEEHGREIQECKHWINRVLGIVVILNLLAYVFYGFFWRGGLGK